MAFKRMGCAKQRHDAVAQRANHRAAKALNCMAHGLDCGAQLVHGLFGVQCGHVFGSADNVGKDDGDVFQAAPADVWRGFNGQGAACG